jgi:hypothetical protein
MPLSGYLQDLSLLAGDCLLISPEKKTALIDNSPPGSKASCSPRLTAGTLNDMMLLDETAILYDGKAAHKADEKAESLQSPFTPPTLHIERTENKAYIFSPTTKPSCTPALTPTSTNSLVEANCWSKPTVVQAGSPSTLQSGKEVPRSLTQKENSPLSPPGAMVDSIQTPPAVDLKTSPTSGSSPLLDTTNSPLSTSLFPQVTMHEADEDKSSKINGIPVPAKRPLLTSAALAARTTDAVIADLKQTNRKLPLVDLPTHDVASIGPLPSLSSGSSVNGHSDGYGAEDKEGAEEGADDDNDEDVEDVPTARPKKITERKRRQNAIADSYLQDALQDPAKKHKVLPQDEANQSTRYMVHQAESRQIISSPREYQIELFERAKAKNTIAVLDTGQYPVLILHFIR